MGAELGFEVAASSWSTPPGATGRRRGLVHGHPACAGRGRPGEGRPPCSAGRTRCGASSPTATSGAASWLPDCERLGPGDILLPADGIYAGWFQRADGIVLPAAPLPRPSPDLLRRAHVSCSRPMSSTSTGDLYGEHVRVRFVARLRGEERFERWRPWSRRSSATATMPASSSVGAHRPLRLPTGAPITPPCPSTTTPSGQNGTMRDEGWEPIAVRVDRRRRAGAEPREVRHLATSTEPIIGPGSDAATSLDVAPSPGPPRDHAPRRAPGRRRHLRPGRAARRRPRLLGRGLPLRPDAVPARVLGFKVIAVDTAGHGGTLGLPTSAAEHGELRRAARPGPRSPRREARPCSWATPWAGASSPSRGQRTRAGDRRHPARRHRGGHLGPHGHLFRVVPPFLVGDRCHAPGRHDDDGRRGSRTRSRPQARPAVAPTIARHARRPWRLLGPMASIMRSRGTK